MLVRQLAGAGKAQQIKENIVHRCDRLRSRSGGARPQFHSKEHRNARQASTLT